MIQEELDWVTEISATGLTRHRRQQLPRQGSSFSLLINGDQQGQATACAAYLATSVLSTVNVAEFMLPVVVPAANGQPENRRCRLIMRCWRRRYRSSWP